MKWLSLCVPTNGISEWVFPCLDSIYSQGVDETLFEVVVTDNGESLQFSEEIKKYKKKHANLIYKRTQAKLFHNQIEALKLASGVYLKFVNHRAILRDGSIDEILETVVKFKDSQAIIYFSNGVLEKEKVLELQDFDAFVRELGVFASWTSGVGVWQKDFLKIPEDHKYNEISPHSDILFSERNRSFYVINDIPWFDEIESDQKKKGAYDLYKAFAIQEPAITLKVFLDGDISSDTLKYVLKKYELLVADFYITYNILRRDCSYDLSGFKNATGVFFSRGTFFLCVLRQLIYRSFRRILRTIFK